MTLSARMAALLDQLELPHPHWSPEEGDPYAAVPVWQLALQKLLRGGHYTGLPNPAHVLASADRAALCGAVPLSLPGALRTTLRELGKALCDQGAWNETAALPWEPLPSPGPAERLYQALGAALRWPAALETPLHVIPEFLAAPMLEHLAASLQLAYAQGRLALQAEGVGKDGQLTEHRDDRVTYLSGLEPALLAELPELAALIQCLLAELPQRLTASQAHAPLRVMLARYEAPNRGYQPHVDNPGGPADNGRRLSFTLYLNSHSQPCQGGELAVHIDGQEPRQIPASGGLAAVFDSRTLVHQVCPLEPGSARWALVFWLSAEPRRAPALNIPPPEPLQLLLAPIPVALPPGTVLLHRLLDNLASQPLLVRPAKPAKVALVATVYRGQAWLHGFCAHHLALGAHHLILVFDHLEEPPEAALAEALSRSFGSALTIWSGAETAATRWPALPSDPRLAGLLELADGGASPHAVCARQTFNASAVLAAARAGDFGAPDWLVHLDADELLHCDQRCQNLPLAFGAASAAGWTHLRLINHELLHQPGPGRRYKLNPRLAVARLGEQGWLATMRALQLEQGGPRPWFAGYHNGKGAIAVARGALAAGVHGFFPDDAADLVPIVLASPCVLHHHNADAATFRRKARALDQSDALGGELFPLLAVDRLAQDCIRQARAANADGDELARRLDKLYQRLNAYEPQELALLEAAGLLFDPGS